MYATPLSPLLKNSYSYQRNIQRNLSRILQHIYTLCKRVTSTSIDSTVVSTVYFYANNVCSRISRTMDARTCAPNLGLMGYPSSEKKVVFSLSLSFSFFTRPTFSPPLVSNLRDPLHYTRSYYYFFFNIEGGGNSLRLLERGFHD